VKRTPLLITIGIVVLIIGGYYLYDKVLLEKNITAWEIVPGDAVLVYEKNSCNQCIENIRQTPIWKIIDRAAFYSKPVDSLKKYLQEITQQENGILISVHATKKDDFDFIFYADNKQNSLKRLWTTVQKGKQFRTSERVFSSVKIRELRIEQQVFSWVLIDNLWVGSFTPFLIEDVIRTYNKNKPEFRRGLSGMQQLRSIKNDAGNLYIRLQDFSEWMALFTNESVSLSKSFGRSSVLDIKSEENSIVLNGFSTDSTESANYILSIFRNQSPVSFKLKQLISSRTAALNIYGVSNGKSFANDLKAHVKIKKPFVIDTLEKLALSSKIDIEGLYNSVRDEIGVCFLEPSKGSTASKVMLVETDQPQIWINAFDKLSQKLSLDTIFYERYSNYEIKEVPVYQFPEKLFWPLVSGFDQSFYTLIGNVVVIGDSLEELKKFLNDIDNENTWGKSVVNNKFLDRTLLEANVSIYFNTEKSLNLQLQSLHPRWQSFILENQSLFNSLQMGALQFSNLNNNFYTNVSLAFKPGESEVEPIRKKNRYERITTDFSARIMGLHAVKNHVNRSDEMLVIDSLHTLSLVSSKGEILWKLPVGNPITGEVHQIDYFNNGKLQYCFVTKDALHVIDRLGNYVKSFPLTLPSSEIEYVSIIDYDHSKKYRFLVTDKNGKLWMYDKEGNNLEGWKPKDIGGSLAMAPQHHRIKGKDYILAIRKDGVIYLINRRGENLKNFPLTLEAKTAGSYVLEIGKSLQDTYFIVISRDGYRIKFTVEGKLGGKETLLKTSFNTQFSLISDKLNKSYLIVQQDLKQVNIQDESANIILSNNSVGGNSLTIKYYDFGSKKAYITISDAVQELTYLYDIKGKLLSVPPVESSFVEIHPFDSGQIRCFLARGSKLTIQPLQ
jgi:hypothetical protein